MAEKTTIHVEGMTCSNCAQGVARFLEHKGLKQVSVDFASGEVSYEALPALNQDEIFTGIRRLGYQVNDNTEASPARKQGWLPGTLEFKFLASAFFTVPLLMPMVLPIAVLKLPLIQFFCLPVMFIGMAHFGRSALASLRTGIPNMDVLIAIGSLSAFVYSVTGWLVYESADYFFFETAATIITLVLLGNLIEKRSVLKTTSAIRELAALQPQLANRISIGAAMEEQVKAVDVSEIRKGDAVLVHSGGVVPVDGQIYWGSGSVDESALTGESIPATRVIGDMVLAGSSLLSGSLKVVTEKTSSQSVLSNIIELVKQARLQKPAIQKLGDKVSAWFVPAVLIISAGTFITWYTMLDRPFAASLMSAVAVLVISCPCAMGLATPTAVAVGLGKAAREGIIVKGGSTLEQLSSVKTAVFDKTGTLTTGNFTISAFNCFGIDKAEGAAVISSLEQYSSHPIAVSLVRELKKENAAWLPLDKVNEEKGTGISGVTKEGDTYMLGSYRSHMHLTQNASHTLYLSKNDQLVATLDLRDELRAGALQTISLLEQSGIHPVLLSGDSAIRCKEVADALGIQTVYSGKLPHEKTEIIKSLRSGGPVLMVGDGINDAPSLATADVGMSFGDATHIAVNSASVVLLKSTSMEQVQRALVTGKQTMITIRQNLFWAFLYNVVAIPIAAMGMLNPMVAAFSMAFSDVVVIGNSIRLRFRK